MTWVQKIAKTHPFPIQNLPWGVAKFPDGTNHSVVAIGDSVLSLKLLAGPEGPLRALLKNDAVANALQAPLLNDFMSAGVNNWRAVRAAVTSLLKEEGGSPLLQQNDELRRAAILPQTAVSMQLPCAIGDYTDFYISRHHATNLGKMFRPDSAPLLPNWLHLPVGYHGRSSSIIVSGTPVRRPNGQRKPPTAAESDPPVFGASAGLDFELEMACYIGTGNELGQPIPIDEASSHFFGFSLFNDWSARDLQKWEYVPLGPFLGKNFASTVGAWIVSPDALAPFQRDGPSQADVPTLPYLGNNKSKNGSYAVDLQVELQTKDGEKITISKSNMNNGYWSPSQMLAHHTCNGCNMRPGDLIATGTLSGPTDDSLGCMLEICWQGTRPLKFPSGQERKMLLDGDTLIIKGQASNGEYTIGFGECVGQITPAIAYPAPAAAAVSKQ